MSNSKGQLFHRNPQSFYNALRSTGTRIREESKWIGRKKGSVGWGWKGEGFRQYNDRVVMPASVLLHTFFDKYSTRFSQL